MKVIRHRTRFFSVLLVLLIIVLSAFSLRLTSTVMIQGNDVMQNFTNKLGGDLENLAIVRARSIVPGCEWLTIDGDPDGQVRQFIEENLGNTIRSSADSLSRDSNLAWIARYKDKEYRHNWKDAYHQNEGALDYTIRSTEGGITYSGAIQPNYSFARKRSILVNPSLVPEERRNTYGSEYFASLGLPDGFSIRFYVPKTISPNGGMIAQIASHVNENAIDFCMRYGTLFLALELFLYPYAAEEKFKPFVRMCRMKAGLVIVLLGLMFTFIGSATSRISIENACGNLQLLYASFAMTPLQSELAAGASVFLVWILFFCTISMTALYLKRIFKKGAQFIQDDTFTYWAIMHTKKWVLESFSPYNRSTPEVRVALVAAGACAVMALALFIGAMMFGIYGLLAALVVCILGSVIMIVALGKEMARDFQKVYTASKQLAEGNFSSVVEDHVGLYQPLYDELLHVSDSYESALKDGLSSQVSKTQLISNVSHDLKTPVAGIQSYSELISMTTNMDDIQHYAKHLQNYSRRLTALIEDLLDITKATSGDIVLEPVRIDLCELVEQVEVEWEDSLKDRHLETVLSLDGPVMIDLDPGKMVRVIDNLFSNIMKYSLPGSRVFITLVRRETECELSFRNTSATILDFDPEKIMERFVRGDSSRHETGSGLGLAIVKSFIEIQDGTFEIETDGDLFKARIRFPIDPAANKPAPLHKADIIPPVSLIEDMTPDTDSTDTDTGSSSAAEMDLPAQADTPDMPANAAPDLVPETNQEYSVAIAENDCSNIGQQLQDGDIDQADLSAEFTDSLQALDDDLSTIAPADIEAIFASSGMSFASSEEPKQSEGDILPDNAVSNEPEEQSRTNVEGAADASERIPAVPESMPQIPSIPDDDEKKDAAAIREQLPVTPLVPPAPLAGTDSAPVPDTSSVSVTIEQAKEALVHTSNESILSSMRTSLDGKEDTWFADDPLFQASTDSLRREQEKRNSSDTAADPSSSLDEAKDLNA